MKKILILCTLIFHYTIVSSQYSIEWTNTYGGLGWDEANDVIQTSDNGLVLVGFSKDVEKYFRIIKLDSEGNILWDKSFIDSTRAEARCVTELSDGSLIIGGTVITNESAFSDMKIMKLDAYGNVIWDNNYGGNYNDGVNCIIECSDGFLRMAGYTETDDTNNTDWWVVKIDTDGNLLWEESYGGRKLDIANDIIETSTGYFLISGFTMSKGEAVRAVWILTLDSEGYEDYNKTYKHSYWSMANSVIEVEDGYIISATTKVEEGLVNFDMWIFKINKSWEIVWEKVIGNENWDEITGSVLTFDGGVAVSGFQYSKFKEDANFRAAKITQEGVLQWSEVFERGSLDYPKAMVETYDKGIVIAGATTKDDAAGWEFALMKLKNENLQINQSPILQYLNLQKDTSITSSNFPLKICIESASYVESVSIFVNYMQIAENSVTDTIPKNETNCNLLIEKEITLKPGPNIIEATATNLIGTGYSEKRTLYFVLFPKNK